MSRSLAVAVDPMVFQESFYNGPHTANVAARHLLGEPPREMPIVSLQ